ncbi:N-acetylmuramoyl-L-alanine amidase [Escherichia coli]|nr:N-acetylmuramoyl-L-alanine amidase [Escherichia coli]EGO8379643.1 N-acetylmuramoyl-L-alanine amidase [Escherichia coli]MCH0695080.1 N-acetylmuramoyl-L-alanine amidase [Escherichia coli]
MRGAGFRNLALIRYPYNGDAIGIEVVCLYVSDGNKGGSWNPVTAAQKKSVNKLVDILMNIYELSEGDIYGHDKISYKTAGEGDGLYGNS